MSENKQISSPKKSLGFSFFEWIFWILFIWGGLTFVTFHIKDIGFVDNVNLKIARVFHTSYKHQRLVKSGSNIYVINCDKVKTHSKTKLSSPEQIKKPASFVCKVYHIIPLGYVHSEYIEEIKLAVKKFYGFDCVILPMVEPEDDILAPSLMRYEAGKILKKYDSRDNCLIITEEDIACPNKERKSPEWGVFGLGNQPGTTCVVSTFRLNRTNGKLVSSELLKERLDKVALHEIGHNLGLDHCTNDPQCMMSSARGTILEVDQERIWFCDSCRKVLKALHQY